MRESPVSADRASASAARVRREAGFVAIFVAILAVLIIGFLGLAVDSGHVQAASQQLQDAADSAALAGAVKLAGETNSTGGGYPLTRAAAVSMAALNRAAGDAVVIDSNTGNDAAGDIVVGTWNPLTSTFTPGTTLPNAVKVVARRTASAPGGALALNFGGVVGVTSSDVSRNAIATFTSSTSPYIHVLDAAAASALYISGNAVLGASGGRVQVNSTSPTALNAAGNAKITAVQTNVCGNATIASNASVSNLRTGAAGKADPLASVLSVSAWTTLKASMTMPAGVNGKISATGTYSPGNYPKGLALATSSVATLLPGTYMFGTTFTMTGSSKLIATGATILCDSGVKPSVSGSAGLALTPPLSGTYKGLMLMCHRSTTGVALTLSGNGVIDCQGTFYVPGGSVTLSGNGVAQGLGQIICLKLTQSGNANVSGINVVPATTSGGGMTALVH